MCVGACAYIYLYKTQTDYLLFGIHCQVRPAQRHSPPGHLLCLHKIATIHPWRYEHDTSGFPAALSMHDLSGRVISYLLLSPAGRDVAMQNYAPVCPDNVRLLGLED